MLMYLEPREGVSWLQMSYYFCWKKSENWSKCRPSCFRMYCMLPCSRLFIKFYVIIFALYLAAKNTTLVAAFEADLAETCSDPIFSCPENKLTTKIVCILHTQLVICTCLCLWMKHVWPTASLSTARHCYWVHAFTSFLRASVAWNSELSPVHTAYGDWRQRKATYRTNRARLMRYVASVDVRRRSVCVCVCVCVNAAA